MDNTKTIGVNQSYVQKQEGGCLLYCLANLLDNKIMGEEADQGGFHTIADANIIMEMNGLSYCQLITHYRNYVGVSSSDFIGIRSTLHDFFKPSYFVPLILEIPPSETGLKVSHSVLMYYDKTEDVGYLLDPRSESIRLIDNLRLYFLMANIVSVAFVWNIVEQEVLLVRNSVIFNDPNYEEA